MSWNPDNVSIDIKPHFIGCGKHRLGSPATWRTHNQICTRLRVGSRSADIGDSSHRNCELRGCQATEVGIVFDYGIITCREHIDRSRSSTPLSDTPLKGTQNNIRFRNQYSLQLAGPPTIVVNIDLIQSRGESRGSLHIVSELSFANQANRSKISPGGRTSHSERILEGSTGQARYRGPMGIVKTRTKSCTSRAIIKILMWS